MSAFHNVSFPLRLAFGASGGPSRTTQIAQLTSGGEVRNAAHAHSRRRYNAAAGIKSNVDLQRLVSFFEARFGQLYGFRFRDPVDHLSCEIGKTPRATDQFIGVGDGIRTVFQLVKNYGDAQANYARPITKPVPDSVVVSVDDNDVSPEGFTVGELTGEIVFVAAPAPDAVIRAGFEFDVAVRFDADRLDLSLEAFGAGELTSVPLVELPHA